MPSRRGRAPSATCPRCGSSSTTTTILATSPRWRGASSDHWMTHGRPDKLVLSFHGVPRRTLELGDPYHCECQKTGRLLAEQLKLRPDGGRSSPSRAVSAGPNGCSPIASRRWSGSRARGSAMSTSCAPASRPIAWRRSRRSTRKVRAAFLGAGGREFGYIPCLNDQHEWIAALAGIAIRHMQGWDADAAAADGRPRRSSSARQRALAAGARCMTGSGSAGCGAGTPAR